MHKRFADAGQSLASIVLMLSSASGMPRHLPGGPTAALQTEPPAIARRVPSGAVPEYQPALHPILNEIKKLTAGDAAAGDELGYAVAVSADTIVTGADRDDDAGNDSGSAYVFERNQGGGNAWGQVKKLVAADAAAGDRFGHAVAVSGDTIVVGAPLDGDGSAYVFERDQGGAGNWGQAKKLVGSNPAGGDEFGQSVAISGDTVIVGAYSADGAVAFSGAAYVFERDQGGADNWGEVKKLVVTDAAAGGGDWFGWSVAVSGDTAIGGAPFNNATFDDTGAAYIFERDQGGSGNWGQVRKLITSDADLSDNFGWSVAIAGDTAVGGAIFGDAGSNDTGAAYVFERDQGGADNWGEVRKLVANDATGGDSFGRSIAIAADDVVVGADNDDDAGGDSGSAYAFERNRGGPNGWGQAKKLTSADAAADDRFGWSVAISGDTAVVGAHRDDDAGNESGSAYVFVSGIAVGMYVLDGHGGVHSGGTAVPPDPEPPYFFHFGLSIARDVELSVHGGMYVLDAYGGVSAADGAPSVFPPTPYFGIDMARDLEFETVGMVVLNSHDTGGFYVLDGFGGVHVGGGAPALAPATPYFGFDIARDLELAAVGYYVLDGAGGVHPGGGAAALAPATPYFGFDIARDLELTDAGGYYVLDGLGGLHAGGTAPVLAPGTPYFGFDIARDLELVGGGGFYVLDGHGGVHLGGGAPALMPATPYFGFDIAKDLELR